MRTNLEHFRGWRRGAFRDEFTETVWIIKGVVKDNSVQNSAATND
jgi:hypothetical protein